mmetsp:Transcript_10149/g.11524  ORF Transcript_10149/g.11524 Transcript_10149/m.11524 type:complete len:133 (-) Transcript_10149:127-525(-)
MRKLFLALIAIALCFAVHAESRKEIQQGGDSEQRKYDSKIIETDYQLDTNKYRSKNQDDNSAANDTNLDALEDEEERNHTTKNDSNCSGNETNFSQCNSNSTSKINQILHLNLGSAFIPGIVISFCLMVLFF